MPSWGGLRPGAGRPRLWLHLQPPQVVMEQLEEIARAEGASLDDVVIEAIMSFIADWQAKHDADNAT